MADAAPATDAVAMLELQVTIFPLFLPNHLIAFMWALIVVAGGLAT
jgi:hypothetical protein